MNIVFGALIVVVACAVTISAMLLVRRRAPEGSYFSDGDRASVWFVQPPRRFRLDRCQTRCSDFAAGRLSGDGPCGRLAGRPGRLAGLPAGLSGG
jgi:hypothetical protein